MRESQYIDVYLDRAAKFRWTPGTFLAYYLSGRAKEYAPRYKAALMRAIRRRIERGEVVPVVSSGGGVAYVRVVDLDRFEGRWRAQD